MSPRKPGARTVANREKWPRNSKSVREKEHDGNSHTEWRFTRSHSKSYDVANEFYELWLDPTLCYSCALWDGDEPDSALETAQLRKLDFHANQSQAKGAARVLDVGCGWGLLVRRLVGTHGVRHATGLTLSDAQAAYSAQRPDPRVQINVESWVDHAPEQPYDGIISVGAFEHFAKAEWPNGRMRSELPRIGPSSNAAMAG